MKIRLLFLLLIISGPVASQDYYEQLMKESLELINKKDYTASLQRTENYLKVYRDESRIMVFHAFNLINLNRVSEAEPYIRLGLQMEPSNYLYYVLLSYLQAANGHLEEAKNALMQSFKFRPLNSESPELVDEIKTVGENLHNSQFASLAAWAEQQLHQLPKRELTIDSVINELARHADNATTMKELIHQYASHFEAQQKPELSLSVFSYGAMWLNNYGYASEALDIALEGYPQYKKVGNKNPFLSAVHLLQITKCYNSGGDYEHLLPYANEAINFSDQLTRHTADVTAMQLASHAYRVLGKKDEAAKYAYAAYKLAEKDGNIMGQSQAANALCAVLINAANPNENKVAVQYGELALELCMQYQLPTIDEVRSNLALGYWNLGTEGKRKCVAMYLQSIQNYQNKNRMDQASLSYNNLGAMYYNQNLFAEAATYFEESVKLAPDGSRYTNPKDRLAFYQEQLSAYQFMVACYAQTRNAEKAFEAMEGMRARVLAERLQQQEKKKASLADLQKLLKDDEACLMYSVFSGHEIIILVVTKKYAQVIFHDDPQFIGDIKEKYFTKGQEKQPAAPSTNRGYEWVSLRGQGYVARDSYDREAMASRKDFDRIFNLNRKYLEEVGINDEFLLDCMNRYHKFLIVPVLNRLTGIKNLLIAPDDVLNLLPFEALRSYDGKYLVEKYNIRYLHSASVLEELQQRNYPAARKPLLAMGGAVYQEMDAEPMPIHSSEDFNALQVEVYENLKNNASQRKAYATLFGQRAMNPLPGTLDEVKNISKNLPGSEIYSGTDMTENRIKSLSASGKLKDYKILHLATHGFVVPDLPELSGVAMCIFPKEQNEEDGFLNASEMANLKLNADLTVLSACQTAQGKIYAGEGVTGLTQSLIVAGSNAALVSLWPVNDTSTMLFMSNFYKEVAKGKSYLQITNELKRKFIKGEFGKDFQHPNYWAPFIYYGR
jgi:CHAT domain-containing protein/Flp pilus assembly protein TadD